LRPPQPLLMEGLPVITGGVGEGGLIF
jgi:hypothetical protein